MAGSHLQANPTRVQVDQPRGGFPKCMKPGPDGALSLRDQARIIACSCSDPATAWRKLCDWASAQTDPKAAMHPVLFQMVDKHGADPRFSAVAEEVASAASAARASMPERAAENLAAMLGKACAPADAGHAVSAAPQPSSAVSCVQDPAQKPDTGPESSAQKSEASHFLFVRELASRANDDSGIIHLPPESTTDNNVSGPIYRVVEMLPDNRNPAQLRAEARSIAAKSPEPFTAWTELRRWSLGKGPAATKVAVMEFIEQHGRRPEAAAIIPEIARLATAMPEQDRKEMLDVAHRSFSASAGFERSAPQPRVMGQAIPKGRAGGKAAKDVQAPSVSPDIARMIEQRDVIFHVNRGGLPIPRSGKQADVARMPLTRQTFAPVLNASHGHVLINSLSDRLSAHGHEMAPVREAAAPVARPARRSAGKAVRAAAKKAAKRRSAKRAARKKAALVRRLMARKPSKKPGRKKSRRK